MNDWYPATDPNSQGFTPPAGGPSASTSEVYGRVDERDYGPPRGYLGDIPAAHPARRIGGLLIDAVVSVVVPFYVAAILHLPGGLTFAAMVLGVLVNEGSGFENGQTVGKQLMRLQAVRSVVTRSGTHALVNRGYVMTIARAVAHSLDWGLWFLAIPLICVDRYHRSIGDILTRTKVIQPSRIDQLQPAPRHAITTF